MEIGVDDVDGVVREGIGHRNGVGRHGSVVGLDRGKSQRKIGTFRIDPHLLFEGRNVQIGKALDDELVEFPHGLAVSDVASEVRQ